MKTIIILCILFFANIVIFAQEIFIYGEKGEKIYFQKIDSIVQIKFKDKIDDTDKIRISQTVNSKYKKVEVSKSNRVVLQQDKNIKLDYGQLMKNKSVVYANQSLLSDEGFVSIPTDKILVRVKSGYRLDDVINELKVPVEKYRRIGHNQRSYLITLPNGESISTANRLFESGYFDYAQPSFTQFEGLQNEHYTNQWGLNNTGQYGGTSGIDIKANSAWGITSGNANISIAVIDQGVDLVHPDLTGNLLSGYDATDGGLGGTNGRCWGNDAHGTACAGIIAAINNAIGIRGVASNCRIIPIRVTYTINNQEIWDDDWRVDAVNYAWDVVNADVISCSWRSPNYLALSNEIHDAVISGRNGLGCVVVFAAGNFNESTVSYPASLNDVIAVGAMSQCGARKRSSSNWKEVNSGVQTDPAGVSCDGEKWWGSNYGSQLDVVAPGVKIYTTDIQGTAGYNTSSGTNGNYYSNFNGTSAACPHVAGIVALILSVRPDLTQAQVRQAIESTCTKLSGYTYSNHSAHPNGTWESQTGHGLVNAYAAVNAVALKITGPSSVCPGSTGTFAVNNLPTGISVRWSSSLLINANGNSATVSNNAVLNNSASENNLNSPVLHIPSRPLPPLLPVTCKAEEWIRAELLDMGITLEKYFTANANSVDFNLPASAVANTILTVTAATETPTTVSWSITPTTGMNYEAYSANGLWLTFAQNGTYTVRATTTNTCGTYVKEKQVTISGSKCNNCLPLELYVIAYPNPASDWLNIELRENEEVKNALLLENSVSLSRTGDARYQVCLYDGNGNRIDQKETNSKNIQFSTSKLPNGFYYIHVTDKTNNSLLTRQTVVIQH